MRILFQILAVLAAVLPLRAADDALVFDQRYRSGYRYHQTITTTQEMVMEVGIERTEQNFILTLGMAASVTDIPGAAGKRVAVSYDHAAMSQKINGQQFDFDSKQPDATKAGPLIALGGIVGQEFKVIFDSEDNVKEVENFEATIHRMTEGNPNSALLYMQLFNKETLKQMLQQSFLRSPPGKPMKVGDAWPFTYELPLPGVGKLTVRGFYTYKGRATADGLDLAQVEAKADIQVELGLPEAGKKETLLEQLKMKVEEGRLEGTLTYDPAAKFTREIEIVQSVTLTAEVPDGTRTKVRLPMKQRTKVVLDLFEKIP